MTNYVSKLILLLTITLIFRDASAQTIVLRDLSRISPATIQNVDQESISLADGQKLTWDRILQADVDSAWQNQIDQNIHTIGEPLYRLKHRLQQGNISGAYEIARRWYQNDERSFASKEANFLVCRAMALGHIEDGDRELVMQPLLQSLILQQQCEPAFLESVSQIVFAPDAFKTGIDENFLPIWSSQEQAASQIKLLSSNFELDQHVSRWPGLAVYLSSMAIHAKDRQQAANWSAAMQQVPQLRPWQRVLGVNLSQTPLATLTNDLEGSIRVTAMFWWATDKDQQATNSERTLTLLKIVANDHGRHPAIAKLAISKAIELTDDPKLRETLMSEKQGEMTRMGVGNR